MSIKVKYLDLKKLKELKREIKYVASDELKSQLNDYISYEKRGEYLCNILDDRNLLELENISKDCLLLSLL